MWYYTLLLSFCVVGACRSKDRPGALDDTGSASGDTGEHDSDSGADTDGSGEDTADACAFARDTEEPLPCSDCRFADIAVGDSDACGGPSRVLDPDGMRPMLSGEVTDNR